MLAELYRHTFYSLWLKSTLLLTAIRADHGVVFKKNTYQDICFVRHSQEQWSGMGLIECTLRCLRQFDTSCSRVMYDKQTQTCVPGTCTVNFNPSTELPPGTMYYKQVLCKQTHPCVQYTLTESTICLWVEESPLSYTEAEDCCKSYNGHLYTMRSTEKSDILKRANLVPNNQYWIGLNDREEENVFRWVDDGELMSQEQRIRLFKPNQPDNADPGEDCVVYKDKIYLLNDDKCHRQKAYICEIKVH
ncbi:unnamed protein product [Lymnaea stagnalis]|uniref:C-type lectin domain-containing protein n=1 Tax=Lymnaea stagnalis TaxID=6523 RepID=A0AAV2GZL7_LYMST